MAEPNASPDPPEIEDGRAPLLGAITKFLAGQDARALADIRASLAREIAAAGPEAQEALCERLRQAGTDWHHYPRDPLARRIHEVIADRILADGSSLAGIEHAVSVAGKPVVMFANHLSYSDANLVEILLRRSGAPALADRLTVIAGPKVYSNLKRRFSSLCFGTIKTPQSRTLSTEDAVMNVREVARAARRSIDIAHERLQIGEALLVFAEGTRSRSGGMQQFLPGVARYVEWPGVWILPVAIVGTEALFPIGDEALHPVRIVARIGQPIRAGVLRDSAGGDRRLMMDSIALAIAELLPPSYRGVYGAPDANFEQARRVLRHALY
jgi:1-acyl-sn-glycerol-3-phosphate acyltransferase